MGCTSPLDETTNLFAYHSSRTEKSAAAYMVAREHLIIMLVLVQTDRPTSPAPTVAGVYLSTTHGAHI